MKLRDCFPRPAWWSRWLGLESLPDVVIMLTHHLAWALTIAAGIIVGSEYLAWRWR